MPTHVVSFSELDAIRQCGLKWHLAYRERWKPEGEAPALSRGKAFHQVMEAHYRTLLKPNLLGEEYGIQTIIDELVDPIAVLESSGLPEEEKDTVRWIFEGYLERYKEDPLWEVLAVEWKVEDWLLNPNGKRSTFRFKGTVDLLVKDHSAGGGLWIVDHKTCRELPKERELELDDQMALYTWLLRKRGMDVRGAIYNACRSYKLKRAMNMDERFKRSWTTRTDKELETIAAEALETFRSVYGVGRRKDPLTGGHTPPRSPDPDRCRWRCPFVEPCLMSRKGVPIVPLMEDMGYSIDLKRH